eukprot:2669919-Rhodomonas_salina.1
MRGGRACEEGGDGRNKYDLGHVGVVLCVCCVAMSGDVGSGRHGPCWDGRGGSLTWVDLAVFERLFVCSAL